MKIESRRSFLARTTSAIVLGASAAHGLRAAEPARALRFDAGGNVIPAPRDPSLWPAFREQLAGWRQEVRRRLQYDDALYRKPEFAWAASSYCCCFLMMYDQVFYDPRTGQYAPQAVVEEGVREFGGYDSLVLWHAYPRIGVDQRNQFDFYRDMPGGLAGVRQTVETFQRRGVRVYINYNPWDTGTRREGRPDVDLLAEMVRALGVDGIFLDTWTRGGAEFRAKLDAVRPGVVLESELALPLENLRDHHCSWAQWFEDSEAPGVLRNKWIERRHLQHQIKRWHFDHSGELHSAWMNGSGMMVWENVFGSWVAWNARDRSLLRSMLPIQRRFTALFSGEGWTPLVSTEKADVYASLWSDGKLHLWTLVNRADRIAEGPLLKVAAADGLRYFDLVAGCEVEPLPADGQVLLRGAIPARGLGCFLAAPAARLGGDFQVFLDAQAATHRRAVYNTLHPRRQTQWAPTRTTARYKQVPAGMVRVAGAKGTLVVQVRARECGFFDSGSEDKVGFHDAFQARRFERRIDLPAYAIDEANVTNAQFAEFLKASGYRPRHPENFLKHWAGGQPPADKLDHPVVWVDLDDARAYAAWAGKRLPTDEEWQVAAQGGDGREYPWGSGLRDGVCNRGETGDTTPVKAFFGGRSPCGCHDLCGNVWQWTESEASDGRTRFCMIRGGSYFVAKGSQWYVDGGPRPANFAAKFLLMWPGLDRCATIGFRCAADLEA